MGFMTYVKIAGVLGIIGLLTWGYFEWTDRGDQLKAALAANSDLSHQLDTATAVAAFNASQTEKLRAVDGAALKEIQSRLDDATTATGQIQTIKEKIYVSAKTTACAASVVIRDTINSLYNGTASAPGNTGPSDNAGHPGQPAPL